MSIEFNTPAATQLTITPDARADAAKRDSDSFWGADGFGINDVVDLINPLQHIPILSSFYRELTGDTIAPGPRMMGGAVVGGVTGFVASAANVIFEQVTGQDIFESVVAAFEGDRQTEKPVQLAQATPRTASRAPMDLLNVTRYPELEPLDFGAVESSSSWQPAVSSAQEYDDDQPAAGNDVIAALVGEKVAAAHDEYRKAQMVAYVMDVAELMDV